MKSNNNNLTMEKKYTGECIPWIVRLKKALQASHEATP